VGAKGHQSKPRETGRALWEEYSFLRWTIKWRDVSCFPMQSAQPITSMERRGRKWNRLLKLRGHLNNNNVIKYIRNVGDGVTGRTRHQTQRGGGGASTWKESIQESLRGFLKNQRCLYTIQEKNAARPRKGPGNEGEDRGDVQGEGS